MVNLAIGFYNFLIYKSIIFKIGKNEVNNEQKIIGGDTGDVA
jgi:hypothetical protein